MKMIYARHVKCDAMKQKHTTHIFIQKWLDHMHLMSSYLVTIATNSHQTFTKLCLGDIRTDADKKSSTITTTNHPTKKTILPES